EVDAPHGVLVGVLAGAHRTFPGPDPAAVAAPPAVDAVAGSAGGVGVADRPNVRGVTHRRAPPGSWRSWRTARGRQPCRTERTPTAPYLRPSLARTPTRAGGARGSPAARPAAGRASRRASRVGRAGGRRCVRCGQIGRASCRARV